MLAQIIFSVCMVLVLFIVTQLTKTFAKDFYAKISKFVPLIIGCLAIIAQLIFNIITGTADDFIARLDIYNAIKFGFFIASTEVYTYNGVYKLIKKGISILNKTEETLEKVEKA